MELDRFARLDGTRRVAEAVRARGAHRAVGGLWGSSAALLLAALHRDSARPLLVVTADDSDSATVAADLATFGIGDALVLPHQETDVDGQPEPNSQGARARCLSELDERGPEATPWIVLAGLESMLQEAPDVESLARGRVTLTVGERYSMDELLEQCTRGGLRKVPVVLAPGEVSRRGDVLDVQPLASAEAVRLEFFDDELESIRTFDPSSQRSLAVRQQVVIHVGGDVRAGGPRVTSVLPHVVRDDLIVVFFEPLRIDERRQQLLAMGGSDARSSLVQLQETLAPRTTLEVGSLPSQDLDFKILSTGSAVGSGEADPLGSVCARSGASARATPCDIACRTEAGTRRG